MKINELIIKNTYKTNEEKQLLASIDEPRRLEHFQSVNKPLSTI